MHICPYDCQVTKCTSNLHMENLGIVCPLLHHFPSKEGLGINMSWPALKYKQSVLIQLTPADAINNTIDTLLLLAFYWVGGGSIKVHTKYNTSFFGAVSDCF